MALTRGIKNCRISGKIEGCSPHQLLFRLTGNRPQSALFIPPAVSGQAIKRPEKQIGLFLKYCILAFA